MSGSRQFLFAFAVLLFGFLAASFERARADDPAAAKDMTYTTLSQRLLFARFVGLTRLGGDQAAYNLEVYRPEEYEHKVQGKAELDELRRKHHVENDVGGFGGVAESQEEQKAYQTELQKIRDKYGMREWEASLPGRTTYCRVIAVGQDYLELQDSASKDRTFLLPLHIVARVNMPRPEPAVPAKP